jgi:hypothetical protein
VVTAAHSADPLGVAMVDFAAGRSSGRATSSSDLPAASTPMNHSATPAAIISTAPAEAEKNTTTQQAVRVAAVSTPALNISPVPISSTPDRT